MHMIAYLAQHELRASAFLLTSCVVLPFQQALPKPSLRKTLHTMSVIKSIVLVLAVLAFAGEQAETTVQQYSQRSAVQPEQQLQLLLLPTAPSGPLANKPCRALHYMLEPLLSPYTDIPCC